MTAPQAPTGILERDAELARAEHLVTELGSSLVLEGATGTGKTTLLDRAAAAGTHAGAHVQRAAGAELETELPFGVVRQLFVGRVRERGVDRVLRGPAALAAPALGIGSPATAGDPLGQALHGLHWLALDLADEGPLLFVVDDTHWADLASLRFLVYLAHRVAGTRVGLLAAGRPPDDERRPLLRALAGDSGVLHLGPLSRPAAAAIVRDRRPDADDAVCGACYEATAGNPFLLHEIAAALAEHDGPVEAQFAGLGEASFARMIRERVAAVGPDAQRLAESVALFADDAPIRHAAALAGLPAAAAADAADRLVDAQILRRGAELRFRHRLLRDAVAAGLSPGRRAHDHGRIADLFLAEAAPADRVSIHLLAAEPAGRPDWADALAAAAGSASAAGAPETALRLLVRAEAEPPAPARRGDIRFQRGLAELAIGSPSSADTLLEAVDGSTGAERITRLFALGQALAMTGRFAEAVRILEREAAALEDVDADLALRLRGEAYWIAWQNADMRETRDRLLARLADAPGDATLAEQVALCYRSQAALAAGRPAVEVVDLARRAVVGTSLADGGLQTGAPMSFAVAALAICDALDDARGVLARAEAAMRARGELIGVPMAHAQIAWLELLRGDLAAAAAAVELANAALETQPPWHVGRPWVAAMDARVHLERGDAAAALSVAGDGQIDATSSFAVALLSARGEARAAAGDLGGALADLDAAAAWAAGQGLGEAAAEEVMRGREVALVHLRRGDERRARDVAERAREGARALGGARLLGETLHVLALVDGGPAAITQLEEAAEQLAASPARLAEAKALVDLGAALRRANRRADARDPLRRGLELAHACGAHGLVARAQVELRAAGARPRRVALSGVDALTPSERRIAELAASGLTNREIAQHLFITMRTVEMHLSNTFRKLDVSSRAQLAPLLQVAS